MGLTQTGTDGIKDDAVTADKLANAINTDIAAKAVLTGSTNNTITTVTGANAIQGEANLTFDGGALSQTIDANDEGINITAAGAHAARFKVDSNQTGANDTIFFLSGRWNTSEVASIHFRTGADTTNKDDGRLTFHTTPSGGSLTERLRITEDGKVGIGTIPVRDLEVKGASGDPVHFKLEGDPSDYARIMFADGTDDNIGEIRYNFGSDYMSFTANAAERLRIQAGGGISFNGDTAAANALDDYEEGTFTASFWASSASFSTAPTLANNNGRYTKIGNQVSFSVYVSWASNGAGGAGNIYMSGLPFTQGNTSVYSGVSFGWWSLDAAAMSSDETLTGYINSGQSYVVLYKSKVGAGSGAAAMNVNDFMNGKSGDFQMNGTYYV